jgi:hypothetical protein
VIPWDSAAEEQIRTTGTLSQRVYAEVLPKVEEERLKSAQVEEGNKPTESEIDDGFLSCIEERRELFECLVDSGYRLADERYSGHLAYHSLPPEEVMDKVLRYETRVQKQLDWALQKAFGVPAEAQEHLRAQGAVVCQRPK